MFKKTFAVLIFLTIKGLTPAVPAFAAGYDPDADRAALRGAANACYDETVRAAGLALTAEKAPAIQAGLDEAVRQCRLAGESAKTIETEGGKRAAEMAALAAGRGGPAPDAEAKDAADKAAAGRARWTKASSAQDDLKKRVDALPDKKDDGKPNAEKRALKSLLSDAGRALDDADSALKRAEAAASAMSGGAERLLSAKRASSGPAGERAAYDGQVAAGADAFPAAAAEAKDAVGRLGQAPVEENKAAAWRRLDPLRDRAREVAAAADRACNRADDFHERSKDFDRGWSAFDAARRDGAGAPAAAAAALDDAEKAQGEVKDRLDHPRP